MPSSPASARKKRALGQEQVALTITRIGAQVQRRDGRGRTLGGAVPVAGKIVQDHLRQPRLLSVGPLPLAVIGAGVGGKCSHSNRPGSLSASAGWRRIRRRPPDTVIPP